MLGKVKVLSAWALGKDEWFSEFVFYRSHVRIAAFHDGGKVVR